MKDGLYRVDTPHLCAGFVIEEGKVRACAPILQRRFQHWMAMAEILPEDLNLPETYQPRSLRAVYEDKQLREIVYACGYYVGDHSYGMFAGPSPRIDDMLDIVPQEDKIAFLLRFNINGTEDILYRWAQAKRVWKRLRNFKDD